MLNVIFVIIFLLGFLISSFIAHLRITKNVEAGYLKHEGKLYAITKDNIYYRRVKK